MTRKVFLILLALALAISVGLVACSGGPVQEEEEEEEQLELMVYQLKPVDVTLDYVGAFTSALFPIGPAFPEIEETDYAYYMSLEPYYLECCKNSGSIWYADESKAYNETYAPQQLPSEDDARESADAFLESLIGEVIPEPESVEYEFLRVGETGTITLNIEIEETETVINHRDVLYSFGELDGIPVWGPGAKIRVSIGDEGEVIGLHYVWREMKEAFGAYPAISEDDAIEIFKEGLEGEPEKLNVELVYCAESQYEEQEFLQPYWLFASTMMVGAEEVEMTPQLIPATTFSPVARIVSPDKYAEFDEGDIITFNASVSGGTPPYDYAWKSHPDGVIGTEASPSTEASLSTDSLSVLEREGEVLPHVIYLTVTDRNGNQGVALSPVKVVPMQSTSILTTAPPPKEIQTPSNTPMDDDNDYEVGTEAAGWYATQECLVWTCECAERFRETLVEEDGWDPVLDVEDYQVWEQDFKCRSCEGGGRDYERIDTVDFAYFAGHGGSGRICLGDTEHDEEFFYVGNARWGGDAGGTDGEEGDLEWIVLDCCKTLKPTNLFRRWYLAFNGLHYALGFESPAWDSSIRGEHYAQYLIQGETIRDAWMRITQGTEPSEVWDWDAFNDVPLRGAYIRATGLTNKTRNDHLPGHGYVAPDPVPPLFLIYKYWVC